jgi:hypothetical protein
MLDRSVYETGTSPASVLTGMLGLNRAHRSGFIDLYNELQGCGA